ncbi:MAG: CoA ester lyase [Candidatus Shapirobacteria bacterium]|nr:CoA ester lyase [Candidatus Shapirobacteria bacterium]
MNETYLMRSLMFVPAHNNKLLESAVKRDADVLLLDIEDSVPSSEKQKARNNIKDFVKRTDFNDKLLFPRVNDRESGELLKDAYQLTIRGISGFLYPKAKKGEDIYFFGKLLETIEYEKNIPIGTFKIIPLIETAGAVMNIQDICTSCPNRVIAVAFGCEDFVTDLGGKHDNEGQSIFTARAMIAMGAKANGVIPIDTVHIKVHDLDDLERNLKISKKLGYEGMLILNPKELPLAHQYFSPSEDELSWAKEMLSLSEEAISLGKGVAVKDNKFIGPPMVKMAKNILKKQELIDRKLNFPCL